MVAPLYCWLDSILFHLLKVDVLDVRIGAVVGLAGVALLTHVIGVEAHRRPAAGLCTCPRWRPARRR